MNYYADADFFLALIKSSDWLKSGAEEIYRKNKGNIITSYITIAEVLFVIRRIDLDPEIVVESIFKISEVEDLTKTEAMTVAHLMKHEKMNVFDAFHAVLARNRVIISSDEIYDKIRLERIKLQ